MAQRTPNRQLSQKVIEHAECHARTYSDEHGERLNIWAIVLAYKVTKSVFYSEQKGGWPALGGRSLDSVSMPYQVNLGRGILQTRQEATYLEADLNKVLRKEPFPIQTHEGTWVDRFTFKDAQDKLYATREGVPEHFPEESKDLVRSKNSRFGKISPRRVRPPFPKRKMDRVTIFPINQIQNRIDNRDAAKPEKPLRDGWLTEPQLRKRLGVTKHWVLYWSAKESKLRPGEKALRSDTVPHLTHSAGRPEVEIFCLDDAENISAGKESKYTLGTGKIANRFRAAKLQQAINWLRSFLTESRQSSEVHAEAQGQGIGETFLRKAAKSLKVEYPRIYKPRSRSSRFPNRGFVEIGSILWKLPAGPENTPRGNLASAPASNGAGDTNAETRRGRGRQRGEVNAEVQSRNVEMRKAWSDGTYESKAELARAFKVKPALARVVLAGE